MSPKPAAAALSKGQLNIYTSENQRRQPGSQLTRVPKHCTAVSFAVPPCRAPSPVRGNAQRVQTEGVIMRIYKGKKSFTLLRRGPLRWTLLPRGLKGMFPSSKTQLSHENLQIVHSFKSDSTYPQENHLCLNNWYSFETTIYNLIS